MILIFGDPNLLISERIPIIKIKAERIFSIKSSLSKNKIEHKKIIIPPHNVALLLEYFVVNSLCFDELT